MRERERGDGPSPAKAPKVAPASPAGARATPQVRFFFSSLLLSSLALSNTMSLKRRPKVAAGASPAAARATPQVRFFFSSLLLSNP